MFEETRCPAVQLQASLFAAAGQCRHTTRAPVIGAAAAGMEAGLLCRRAAEEPAAQGCGPPRVPWALRLCGATASVERSWGTDIPARMHSTDELASTQTPTASGSP